MKASSQMTLARTNQQIDNQQVDNERLSDYEDGGQPEDRNKYENDLLLSQIKTKLWPLLLKEGAMEMNFWTTINSAQVESAMNDIVAEIRQHRDNVLSDILSTIKEAVSPNTKKNQIFALLSRSMECHLTIQGYMQVFSRISIG
jgi:hypothetical protein